MLRKLLAIVCFSSVFFLLNAQEESETPDPLELPAHLVKELMKKKHSPKMTLPEMKDLYKAGTYDAKFKDLQRNDKVEDQVLELWYVDGEYTVAKTKHTVSAVTYHSIVTYSKKKMCYISAIHSDKDDSITRMHGLRNKVNNSISWVTIPQAGDKDGMLYIANETLDRPVSHTKEIAFINDKLAFKFLATWTLRKENGEGLEAGGMTVKQFLELEKRAHDPVLKIDALKIFPDVRVYSLSTAFHAFTGEMFSDEDLKVEEKWIDGKYIFRTIHLPKKSGDMKFCMLMTYDEEQKVYKNWVYNQSIKYNIESLTISLGVSIKGSKTISWSRANKSEGLVHMAQETFSKDSWELVDYIFKDKKVHGRNIAKAVKAKSK